MFAVPVFILWSVVMIVTGSVAGNQPTANSMIDFAIPQSHAASLPSANMQITRLDRDRLAGKNLGEFAPYEPESGNLVARGYEYYYSADGNFGIGVWESKPGEMTYVDLEYDELMVVLDGSLVMTDEHGKIEVFNPGEGLVLPKGWTGTLAVPEGGVRKIWVSYMDMDAKKG
jgi:uncharacterized cupin superfamily protein